MPPALDPAPTRMFTLADAGAAAAASVTDTNVARSIAAASRADQEKLDKCCCMVRHLRRLHASSPAGVAICVAARLSPAPAAGTPPTLQAHAGLAAAPGRATLNQARRVRHVAWCGPAWPLARCSSQS